MRRSGRTGFGWGLRGGISEAVGVGVEIRVQVNPQCKYIHALLLKCTDET